MFGDRNPGQGYPGGNLRVCSWRAGRETRQRHAAIAGAATPPTTKENLMSTDAIVLLKDDHKQIRKLFADFQNAGPNATKTKAKIVDKILEALTVHTYIENECMYPAVRELLPAVEDEVLESYEEHHVADVLCMELAAMSAEDERFDAKATVLIENVSHHIEEEEQEWFPQVREGLTRTQLQDIGQRLLETKKKAPHSPAQPVALKKAVDAVLE
jgi:hemerythrin-like domain-containing protein